MKKNRPRVRVDVFFFWKQGKSLLPAPATTTGPALPLSMLGVFLILCVSKDCSMVSLSFLMSDFNVLPGLGYLVQRD